MGELPERKSDRESVAMTPVSCNDAREKAIERTVLTAEQIEESIMVPMENAREGFESLARWRSESVRSGFVFH